MRRRSACENGAVIVQSFPRALGGVVASDFSDPTNERLIYLSAAGLALVGLALLVGTIVWWRRARQEHPALAPLEVMSGRAWAKAPEGDRRRRLEQVRVAGSAAAADGSTLAEPVDLQALVRSVPQAFDDLREPGDAIALPAAEEPVEPANADDVAEADKVEGGARSGEGRSGESRWSRRTSAAGGRRRHFGVDRASRGGNRVVHVVIRHMTTVEGDGCDYSARTWLTDWMSRRCSPDSANVQPL